MIFFVPGSLMTSLNDELSLCVIMCVHHIYGQIMFWKIFDHNLGLQNTSPPLICPVARVAEVVRRHEWPLPKSLDSDENISLNIHTYTLMLN